MRIRAGIWPALLLTAQAQTIQIAPPKVMIDQTAVIRASGLQPNEHTKIQAELTDGADVHWSSQTDVTADAEGKFESPTSGLIWPMMPASKNIGRYQPPSGFGVQTIAFHLKGATAQLEQVSLAEGVQRVTVHEGRLRGVLFLPPGTNPHPGVLILGGSEGGMPTRRAAWLASHGYAALALAYFRFEDLPPLLAGIPLEYFRDALNWMAHRPEIDNGHIGVMGTSRGAELALQLGSMFPIIKAVVAYAPSNVRNPACCGFTPEPFAWAWEGRGLAFRPIRNSQPAMALRAVIEVERTQGPILLISGDADRVWESSSMAQSIVSRLKEHHFAFRVEHLKYPHAGHGSGRPEIVPAWQGEVRNPTSGREMEMGGTPKGNAESTLDAIPKVIDFLNQGLGVVNK